MDQFEAQIIDYETQLRKTKENAIQSVNGVNKNCLLLIRHQNKCTDLLDAIKKLKGVKANADLQDFELQIEEMKKVNQAFLRDS
jgi:hypothetical protein